MGKSNKGKQKFLLKSAVILTGGVIEAIWHYNHVLSALKVNQKKLG